MRGSEESKEVHVLEYCTRLNPKNFYNHNYFFSLYQVGWVEKATLATVVERTTSAFPTIQSMTSTEMAISTLDTCTALNMKCTNTTETLLREISIIMKHHASSASSSHVVQC